MAALTITAKSTQATRTTNTGIGEKLLDRYNAGGHIQAYRFFYQNTTGGTIAANSIIQLCTIGPCHVLPNSEITVSAFGASRTLDVGLQEYVDTAGDTVASDVDAFLDGLDVASAVSGTTFGSDTNSTAYGDGVTIDGQVDVVAQVLGGTLPNNGIIQGVIFAVTL